jgi:hypothetical protein
LKGSERAITFSLHWLQRQPTQSPYFCQIQSAGNIRPPHFRHSLVPASLAQRGLVGSSRGFGWGCGRRRRRPPFSPS